MVGTLLHESQALQEAYDRFLRTLCNKTRLALIRSLRDGPKNVTELTVALKIHQTTVSHGLKRLLDCGFVFVEKRGKERIYSLNTKTIHPLLGLMEKHITLYCSRSPCT
jgi:DNA-binding transcriptional ArsR family regulator